MATETINKPYSGEIFAVMTYPDGRTEKKHFKNLIVNDCALLISELLKSNGSVAGISHLAIGQGVGTGSLQLPTDPALTDHVLGDELFRKAVSISYNTDVDTITDGTRTNVLDITCTFGVDEPNPTEPATSSTLTEMGLFGGTGASSKDGGTMVNMKRFSVWNKPADALLTLTWRIKIQ